MHTDATAPFIRKNKYCLVSVLILALLICNTARCLASGLARGLALAATAVLNGLCNITGLDSLDSVHDNIFAFFKFFEVVGPYILTIIISQCKNNVNSIYKRKIRAAKKLCIENHFLILTSLSIPACIELQSASISSYVLYCERLTRREQSAA